MFLTGLKLNFNGFLGPGVAFFGLLALSEAHPRPHKGGIITFKNTGSNVKNVVQNGNSHLSYVFTLPLASATVSDGFALFFMQIHRDVMFLNPS